MSTVRGLTLPQRVIIVVGLGLCLLAAWSWWFSGDVARTYPATSGWTSYEPGVLIPEEGPSDASFDTYYVGTSGLGWQHLAVPLALIVLWTALSLWLLRPSEDDRGP